MSPAEEPIADPEGPRAPVILVAEDEVLLRLALADHLREAGFTVAEAATAEEARSLLMAGVTIDLVFSDINMPGGLDGVALAQWVASHYPDIPVVVTSGVTEALNTAKAACPHVKAFVAKPYAYDALIQTFRALIAARDRRGR